MSEPSQTNPPTEARWKTAASKAGIATKTIHDLPSVESASKISTKQYLALRILWKRVRLLPNTKTPDLGFSFKNELGEARNYLNGHESWKQYLKEIEDAARNPLKDAAFHVKDIGVFALVRLKQLRVTPRNSHEPTPKMESVPTKIFVSPITSRLRSMNPGTPETPTKQIIGGPSTQEDSDSDFESAPEDSSLVDSSSRPEPQTPAKAAEVSPAEDEQIVNTALILFLNALTAFYGGLNKDTSNPVGWTEKRLQLKFDCSGGLSWVAVTDGFLAKGDQTKAIVEVKPFTRSRALDQVQRQESAQMAAWIQECPDDGLPIPGQGNRKRER